MPRYIIFGWMEDKCDATLGALDETDRTQRQDTEVRMGV